MCIRDSPRAAGDARLPRGILGPAPGLRWLPRGRLDGESIVAHLLWVAWQEAAHLGGAPPDVLAAH
eukprot:218763-Alexandrium_andersonii.AAC.1